MNKIFKVLLIAATVLPATSGKLSAQELNQGLSFLNFKFDPQVQMNANAFAEAYSLYTDSGNNGLAKAKFDLRAKRMYFKSMKASNRASKDFNRTFKGMINPEWQIEKVAIVASYSQNEIRNYVVYDKSGRWVRSMAYLFPDKIPASLRKNITSAYPDYTLNMVLEVSEQGVNYSVAYLESANRIKHVCIYNNEMDVITEYLKDK